MLDALDHMLRQLFKTRVPGITTDSSVDSFEAMRNLIVLPGVRFASLIACRNEQSNGLALFEKQPP